MKDDLSKLKESLSAILKEAKEKNALEEADRKKKNEADRSAIFESVGKDLGTVIGPYLDKLKENSSLSAQELKRIISEAVHVEAPSVDTSGIEAVITGAFKSFVIPTPQINVSVPKIKIPEIKVPQAPNIKWPERMKMLIDGIDMKHPLPVLVVDETGKPFYGGGGQNGTGGGLKGIADIQDPRGVSLIDSITDPSKPVLRTSATVSFPTSSIAAALVDSSGVQYSGSNPLPITGSISVSSGPVGPGDGAVALRVLVAGDSPSSVNVIGPIAQGDSATALRVVVAGNSDMSVVVNNPQGPGDAATALRVLVAGNSDMSVVVNNPQGPGDAATALRVLVAGNSDMSVVVNGITGPIAQGDAASALRVVIAGNSDSSVSITSQTALAVNQGDTGTNTLRVIIAGDSASSVVARGDVASGATDSGNPVKIGAVARTAQPTAVTDGQRVNLGADKLGRAITRPMQIRDLITTAYVTLSTGTEATLLAASAGSFFDLIYIMGANTSTAAVQVDVRSVTAGNVVLSLYIPGNSTAGIALPVPLPQDNQGNNWTVDMGDFTNSNVLISALFSKEV